MTPAPSLEDLIREVHQDAEDDSPLERLRAAAAMSRDMTDVSDAALGYFVDQARRAGHSWTEIGESLGVSKQAAQQRHVARASSVSYERWTPRARNVVTASEAVARSLGHTYIGTEHLLLGLYDEPDGIGADMLTKTGITRDAVLTAVVAQAGRGPGAPKGDLPHTAKALQAMAGALTAALELGHNYIGTEHLVLGLLRVDGLASTILNDAGLDEPRARAFVLEALTKYQQRKQKNA